MTTARTLFRQHGIRAIGVETIAEEAGTNKTTLYRHFDSKDALVLECLRAFADELRKSCIEIERAPTAGEGQLRRWVAHIGKGLASGSRGCEFSNAAAEHGDQDHPIRKFVREFKAEYRDWLAKLCRNASVERTDLLADTLMILYEGSRSSLQNTGLNGPSSQFEAMATAIIDSFVVK